MYSQNINFVRVNYLYFFLHTPKKLHKTLDTIITQKLLIDFCVNIFRKI